MKWLAKYTDDAYAFMRIVTGFMFAFHGCQKILGILSDFQPAMGSQVWFGGLLELVGGLAVMLGYQTRLAYIQFHWQFQMGRNFFPAINKGELAALYSFVFLYIATRGGVKWKLDKTS
jgi:putative oxidoreductase